MEEIKQTQQPLEPTTTAQQDMVKAGQRKINLIWEQTQAKIALTAVWGWIVLCFMIIAAMLFSKISIDPTKIAVVTATLAGISLTVGIIIGFYFSRTNHSAIGGVGEKDQPSDRGTR